MEWTHDVEAPLSERPRAGERAEVLGWLMERMGELLAFFAFSGIELCILLHVGPPVALADGSVGQ